MKMKTRDIIRFKTKYTPGKKDECWLWEASRTPKGYGVFSLEYKQVYAHRISFLLHHGHLPINCACHKCDNPTCINPHHLFDGTHSENMLDAVNKGLTKTGLNHHFGKLSKQQIKQIPGLLQLNWTLKKIAERFGVSHATIWRHKPAS